jgi:hypothetical protein
MKTIMDRPAKDGKRRRVVVELEPGEKLMAVSESDFYSLGGQVEDIVRGHVITEAKPVAWCSVAQEWVPA